MAAPEGKRPRSKGALWENCIIEWLSGLRYPGNTRKKFGMYTVQLRASW